MNAQTSQTIQATRRQSGTVTILALWILAIPLLMAGISGTVGAFLLAYTGWTQAYTSLFALPILTLLGGISLIFAIRALARKHSLASKNPETHKTPT